MIKNSSFPFFEDVHYNALVIYTALEVFTHKPQTTHMINTASANTTTQKICI